MSSVLVVETWGGMGDALLATPGLRALKRAQPDLELRVRCLENQLEVLEGNPFIDYLSCRAEDPLFRNAVVTNTAYGGIRPSISCRKPATDIIADALGVTLEDRTPVLALTESDHEKALNIVAGHRTPISLHVSYSSLRYKNWPMDRWDALVRRMSHCTFIQIGEESDPPVPGTVDVRGMTTVREAAAVVKHTRGFVGVDSCFNHVTAAVGTPGVVLFGPSTPLVWGHAGNVNLYADVACAPCVDTIERADCPFAHRCMMAISVDEGEGALRRTLAL